MNRLTRRQLLALGLAGAGMAAAGGAGLWWTSTLATEGYSGEGGDSFSEPVVLSSVDGLLEIELEAASTSLQIGEHQATVLAFNNSLPGPTLRVSPGDTLRVRMLNRLDAPTNLHVHGLHVSPEGNGDNPFVHIEPGATFDYEYQIPDDHPPGTYWYHPHLHGQVADQLAAGLYGAIIVEEAQPVPTTRERLLVLSDISIDSSGNIVDASLMERMMGREGQLVLVNGQIRPLLAGTGGERERWRIINACPSRYLRLSLEGQQVRLLSRDMGRLPVPVDVTEVELAPGNRVELLVETSKGISTLLASPVNRGAMGGMMGVMGTGEDKPVELLKLEVVGDQVSALPPFPTALARRDLRQEPVARRRVLDFGIGGMMGGMMDGDGDSMMSFTINGREFDAARLDTSVRAGDIEEWTLTNSSPMDHPVHLHVWPMQVVNGGDQDLTDPLWLDVVNVPAFGQITVRIPFEDFTGRTVYHCHILDHEDLGMMGTVEAA